MKNVREQFVFRFASAGPDWGGGTAEMMAHDLHKPEIDSTDFIETCTFRNH
jgi:hypothetical protein